MTDKEFYPIAEAYLDETMRINPSQATVNGYHKYDGLLEDFLPEGVKSAVASYRTWRQKFAAIDGSRLSVSARIDLDLVRNDVESNLFTLTELKSHETDPGVYNFILGYGALFLTTLDDDSPDWPERLASLLSRMEKIPAFLAQAKENLNNPPAVLTDFTIQQNRGNIAFFEASAPPLFDRAPAIRDRLAQQNETVVAALKEYQQWLETDLRPRSKGDWRLGKELWTKKLRYTLQSEMTPEEILERAWARLEAERREMLKIGRPLHDEMFPDHRHTESGDALINVVVGEVIDRISENHSTPESLFDDTRKWVEKIKAFIRRSDLITLPPESDNFVIEPTPGFLDGLAVAFFMPPPAFEPHRKKSFWISSIPSDGQESFLREYNDYGLQSLSIHEAFPGHYVQLYFSLTSKFATIFKKVFSSGTFAEGWAVLCEEMMFEAGYDDRNPATLLIHKKINLRSAMNAILDAKMHTESMSDEEIDRFAMKLMCEKGFQEEAEAVGKLRRARITSTQLSTYFVGYLELKEIYDEARDRAGAGFDRKAFNDLLISFGTIPPRAVRQLLQ